MDILYKKAGKIFNMHSYWTKQPVDAIESFITKYSNPKDTILDPFSGTGMTGVAAIKTSRNVILNDISPVCMHISKGYCTNYSVQKNILNIRETKDALLKGLEEYYLTNCKKCGYSVPMRFSIVGEVWQSKDGLTEENRGELMLKNTHDKITFNKEYIFKEFQLLKICYLCGCSKEKQYKQPDFEDLALFNKKDYLNKFYPQDDFFGQEPKRNYKRGIKKVYQLYSSRNLSVLSIIYDRISNLKNNTLKQLFMFVFTSILFNSSLMSRYRAEYENTSIKMGTFYIPPLIKDTNVVTNFLNKYNAVIQGNTQIFLHKPKSKVRYISENADRLESIKPNSIDYIYTDPPYSDVISYSELNIVFESWLKKKTKIFDELVVNDFQNKDIKYYSKRFEIFLNKCYSKLKKNKYMTIIFHHPNLEHWRYLQNAFFNSKLKPVISKKPIRLISKSKTSSQHKTKKHSQCFLVFNLTKDPNYKGIVLKKLENAEYLRSIEQLKKEAISEGYLNPSDMFDFIINRLLFNYEIKEFTL